MILDEITKSNSILIKQLVSKYYPLSLDLIHKFAFNKIDYQLVLMNENIDWDEQKIIYFFDRSYDLRLLYENPSIYFTSKIIEQVKENLDWNLLSIKKEVDWSLELLSAYEDFWNWQVISSNQSINWSKQMVDRFFYKLNFSQLYENKNLTWLEEFVKQKINSLTEDITGFCDEIGLHVEEWEWTPSYSIFGRIKETQKDWYSLSTDLNLPWSVEYISKRKRYWNWYHLSRNESLPWSIELIDKFKDNWHWDNLSYNPSIPWNELLIDRYKNKWDWVGLSLNSGMNWNMTLIKKYESSINWSVLSENTNISWSLEILETFNEKWDWDNISENNGFLWNRISFETYSHLINWNLVCDEAKNKLSEFYINKLDLVQIESLLNSQSPFDENDYFDYENYDETIERASDMHGYGLNKLNDDSDWDQQGPDFDF